MDMSSPIDNGFKIVKLNHLFNNIIFFGYAYSMILNFMNQF